MSLSRDLPATADVVVVGGGTIGGWCAHFLHRSGAGRVLLVERDRLGRGASGRAAGIVRAQGGTVHAVRLGVWTQDFYRSQAADLGVDSGFVEQGYFLPAFTPQQVTTARARLDLQRALGLDVEWLDATEADRRNPTLAPGSTLGGTFRTRDGWIDPPRNVAAYTAALAADGVQVAEGTAFTGLRRDASGAVAAVTTSGGEVATRRVVLTGGPLLAEVCATLGVRAPTAGVRHQVAVTAPHPDLEPSRLPMVFDLEAGLYWRPEDGGVLFGMSNPDEAPGEAREVDQAYLDRIRGRLAELVPVTRGLPLRKVWAATIDYTPDHLPIIGPALDAGGPVDGATVVSAGGHGMMCGPGISRAAADVVLTGRSDVVDVSELGLDRFDEHGTSRHAADPIALPFPQAVPG